MTALLLLLLALALAAGIGRRILMLTGAAPQSRAERWLYSVALGLAVLAYAVLPLGLLSLLRPAPVGIAYALLAAICWQGFRDSARDLPPVARPARVDPWAIATGCLLAAIAFIAIIDAFVPPAAHEWDALSYHLAAPKVFLQHERIVFLPTQHHSNFPFLIQMLFTVGLMWHGYALADLFHLTTAALTIGGLLAIGTRRSGAVAGRIAALAFATAPIVVWEAGAAYIDVGFTLYVFLAVAAALDYRDTRDPKWLALAGALMGCALGVKALALVPCALAGLLLLLDRIPVRHLARYALVAAVVGCPFYVKTWIVTGNPVYPFAYRVFGGIYWNQQLADTYSGAQSEFGMGLQTPSISEDIVHASPKYGRLDIATRIRSLVLAPFALVALPRIFYDVHDPGTFSHLGFLFLALPILALLCLGTLPPAWRWTGALALLWYASWAESMQYVRYLIPVTPLLALVGADAATRLGRPVKVAACCAVALQAALALAYFGSRLPADEDGRAGQWAVATNAETREDFLTRRLNSYAAIQWINANTPRDAGVVLYEEPRGFYLDRPYLWGNRGHSLYIEYDRMRTGRDMADWFLAHGCRYALVNLQFSTYAEVNKALREAVQNGTAPELFLQWYNPRSKQPGDESWRSLIGDCVLSGAARVVPEASVRGCVVLEFLPPST